MVKQALAASESSLAETKLASASAQTEQLSQTLKDLEILQRDKAQLVAAHAAALAAAEATVATAEARVADTEAKLAAAETKAASSVDDKQIKSLKALLDERTEEVSKLKNQREHVEMAVKVFVINLVLTHSFPSRLPPRLLLSLCPKSNLIIMYVESRANACAFQ